MDSALWKRVQQRREAVGASSLRRMNGRLIGRPSGADVESPYLLSGPQKGARSIVRLDSVWHPSDFTLAWHV